MIRTVDVFFCVPVSVRSCVFIVLQAITAFPYLPKVCVEISQCFSTLGS